MIYGIDFGNLKSRVAVTRRGGVDVILNELSQRDSSSFVSYGEKERFIGEKGFDQAIRNQKNTTSNLKRFLAMKGDSKVLEHENSFISCNTCTADGGDVEFEVSYLGEVSRFRPQQTLAALLRKLHSFVELDSISNGGPPVKGTDCVISCPVYYSVSQRKALLQAAEIAGLNCMALINESTACALDYGIFKSSTFPEFEEGKTGTVVLFADIGHSATTISVTSFWKGSMKVLGTVYDVNLGTREIDNILLQHFRNEILTKYRIDVYESTKARFRLLQAIERMKVMLSANPVSNLNVECLMNDVDISFSNVKREDLEKMIADRFLIPLEKLCTEATQLEGVCIGQTPIEIIGGGSRMPAVKSIIFKVFSIAPNTTLVATESVAKGCAILAAMLSPKFKVREYAIQDRVSRSIHVGYLAQNPSKPKLVDFLPPEVLNYHVPVFKKGETYPKSLDLTFERSDSFDLYYFYADTDCQDVVSRLGQGAQLLGHVKIDNIVVPKLPAQAAQVGNLKVKVRFRLSFTGLMEVESASVVQEYEEEPECTKAESGEETKREKKPPRKKEMKCEATRESKHFLAMAPELVANACKDEDEMARRDRLVFETLEAKNSLEGYMYDYSAKLGEGGELHAFVSQENLEFFVKLSREYETWLWGEGQDSTKEEYEARLQKLKDVAGPTLKRYYNAEQLPREVDATRKELNSRRSKLKTMLEGNAVETKWATQAEIDKVQSSLEDLSSWLEDELKKTQGAPKYADSSLTTDFLKSKLKATCLSVDPVLNRAKPVPKADPTSTSNPNPTTENPSEGVPETTASEPAPSEKTTEVD